MECLDFFERQKKNGKLHDTMGSARDQRVERSNKMLLEALDSKKMRFGKWNKSVKVMKTPRETSSGPSLASETEMTIEYRTVQIQEPGQQ